MNFDNIPLAQKPLSLSDFEELSTGDFESDDCMTPVFTAKKPRLAPPPLKIAEFNQPSMAAELRAGLLGDDACKKLDYVFEDTEIIYPTVEPIPLPELRDEPKFDVEDLLERIGTEGAPENVPMTRGLRPMNKRVRTKDPSVFGNRGPCVKRWCVTYNNPGITCKQMVELLESNDNVTGYVFQLEEGDEKTQHFQMYLEISKANRLSYIKTLLNNNTIHAEAAKGSKKQNVVYCTKEDSRVEGPFVGGTCCEPDKKNGKQGKRTDLDELATRILDEGRVTQEMMDEYPSQFARYGKNLKALGHSSKINKLKEEEKAYWKEQAKLLDEGKPIQGQRQRHVELYFGPTGCGKTTMVKAAVAKCDGDLYEKEGINKWWDGYEGEDSVLLDEFKGDSYGSIEQFNRMTNVGVYQGETKGGHALITASNIYLTTNRHPRHWWKKKNGEYSDWTDPRYQAVARRIAVIHWWDDDMKYRKLINPNEEGGVPKEVWECWWRWYKPDYTTTEVVGKGIFEAKVVHVTHGYFSAPEGFEYLYNKTNYIDESDDNTMPLCYD